MASVAIHPSAASRGRPVPAVTPPGADYTLGEELAHVATHGVGALLSAAGLALLVVLAALHGRREAVIGSAVFGAMLVLLYTASTVYHAVPWPRAKRVAKAFDHACIYLLIAGTYTPFTLVTLRGPTGWALFLAVWSLAVVGALTSLVWTTRPPWLGVLLYVAMGWMVLFAGKTLVASLATGGLALLLAGGLAYTLGSLFYLVKRVRYMHAVWHAFVLGGSVCHFLAVALYVV